MTLKYNENNTYFSDLSGQWILASPLVHKNQLLRVGGKAQGFLLPDYVNHMWNEKRNNWDHLVNRPSQR